MRSGNHQAEDRGGAATYPSTFLSLLGEGEYNACWVGPVGVQTGAIVGSR